MGLPDKIEEKVISLSEEMITFALKLLASTFLGILIVEWINHWLDFAALSFFMLWIVVGRSIFEIIRPWDLKKLAIFNLIMFLSAIALKTYSGV